MQFALNRQDEASMESEGSGIEISMHKSGTHEDQQVNQQAESCCLICWNVLLNVLKKH